LQSRVQRAIVDKKLFVRLLFDELRNPIGVIRRDLQAPEDQDLERTLQELKPLPWIVYPWTVYRSHPTHYV